MKDQDLVNALREHAEWSEWNQYETPITLCDDLAEAADLIEAQAKEIEKLRAQLPRGIPVEERLPEVQSWGASTVVLGLIKSENAHSLNKLNDLTLCVYCDNGIWSMPGRYVAITHWMPLPDEIKSMQGKHFSGLEMAKLHSALMELKKYQEADKDGRLVMLPCKAGDTVWAIANPWMGKLLKKPIEAYVNGMKKFSHGLYVNVLFDTKKINGTRDYEINHIGKTVFLTREEAEKALEAMKNE